MLQTRKRIKVTGVVQGVGFRPFVYQLAERSGISGWVTNTSRGVMIEAEGEKDRLDLFIRALKEDAPRLASVAGIEAEPIELCGETGFTIHESEIEDQRIAMIPADVAMCEACAADISDPSNRRFGYPFTNCTDCGPRFTIIRDIPYDRPGTTMSTFEMCPDCSREYHDPTDRRFHAQPNACPICGPKVWIEDGHGAWDMGHGSAIEEAAALIANGRIVAIKGLGGFHLACDAKNAEAVRELRRRKGRSRKPFAIMVRDLEEARRLCKITTEEEAILLSYERPIVLLEAKDKSGIAEEVAPGNRYLGIMLPYTPLHHLLFRHSPSALVMTSGNLSEEPIVYRNDDSLVKLGHIADAFLMHDRDIHVACDDSVVRSILGAPMPIRRARGFVPGAIDLGFDGPSILACGAEQKNSFCLTVGRWAIPSQHIGDIDNAETLDYYEHAVEHLSKLYDIKLDIVAHDMHPDYLATRYALSLDGPRKLPVQHHHAHIAACMAEHKLTEPVIGVAFDGTGYGTDGAIWGGEFLIADLTAFERAAHLRYVPMPGGSAAIAKPARMALSHLIDAYGNEAQGIAERLLGLSPEEVPVVFKQIERRINSPMTSSMGRLFDSVSALLGLCRDATYEGEPAVLLEMCAGCSDESCYRFDIVEEDGCSIIDTRPIIRGLVCDIPANASAAEVSARFHNTITRIIIEVSQRIRDKVGLNSIVLSGGCFQNARLLESAIKGLQAKGFVVFRHKVVPTNDGGISLGQAAIAAMRNEECAEAYQ